MIEFLDTDSDSDKSLAVGGKGPANSLIHSGTDSE